MSLRPSELGPLYVQWETESLEVPSKVSASHCIPDVYVRRLRGVRNSLRFPPQILSPLPFLTSVSRKMLRNYSGGFGLIILEESLLVKIERDPLNT